MRVEEGAKGVEELEEVRGVGGMGWVEGGGEEARADKAGYGIGGRGGEDGGEF